jgi:hypothetical protein
MRTVLAYAFTCTTDASPTSTAGDTIGRSTASDDAPSPVSTARAAVERWLSGWLGVPAASVGEEPVPCPRTRGTTLRLVSTRFPAAQGELDERVLHVHHRNGRVLRATVALANVADTTHLYASVEAHGRPPLYGQHDLLEMPELVAEALGNHGGWRRSERVVAREPVQLSGAAHGAHLVRHLQRTARCCPAVVVGVDATVPGLQELATRLATRLLGTAMVLCADAEARTALNAALGARLACHAGTVRVYQPNLLVSDGAGMHPFHTTPRTKVLDQRGIDLLVAKVEPWVFEHTAYTVELPEVFEQLRTAHTQAELLASHGDGDSALLATLYAADNTRLKHRLAQIVGDLELARLELDEARGSYDDLRTERDDLQSNVIALTHHESYVRRAPSDGPVHAALGPASMPDKPRTVADAVTRARATLSDDLAWGDEVDHFTSTLAPNAGPPAKVLDHLEKLATLAQALRAGDSALGTDTCSWLAVQNVNASSENATSMQQSAFANDRTWSVVGSKRTFRLHTKPNEATRPDKCVRIYYEWDSELARVVVGYVGPHLPSA